MGVSSFLRNDKQESVPDDSDAPARAEDENGAPRARRKRKQNAVEEPVDPVLPEKKRARRRLIGAVALVLAAVIGLPMILDSEPKPLGEDIAIQIPSKEKPPLADSPRNASGKQAANGKVPAAASLDKNEEVVEPPIAAEAPKAAAALPPSSGSPAGKAEVAGQKHPAKDDANSSRHVTAKADDSARARALLEGAPEPATQETHAKAHQEAHAEKTKASFEKKTGKYMIQVAALASQEKAGQLQGRLKSAGIKSQTQKIATQSGERIRIRVGPFASKEEAEKTRAKLVKMGLSGTLVPA